MSEHYIGRAAEAAARAKANKARRPQPITDRELLECVRCLHGVVKDVLPQMGGIVLQDYERLNRGMILAERILKPRPSRPVR